VRKDSRRLLGVGEPTGLRRYAQVFDAVAADYDVHRPGYPGELVDAALRRGGLAAGVRVLEIGCGTGKLTELLAARGLRIDAVDPGAKLIEAARRRVGDAPNVTFHLGRFEDVELPEDTYDAAFSAAAFHWVEPSVGWEKVACHLRADGLLALLTYLGVTDGATPGVEMELFTVLEEHAPELAADWGPAHDVASLLAATSAHADNVSAVWDVVLSRGLHGLAVEEAATLFRNVETTAVVQTRAWTAAELEALFRTTALYRLLEPAVRDAVERGDREVFARHGGRVELSEAFVLTSALRTIRPTRAEKATTTED
jgi:SAM-dependent methyltransferase